MQEGFVDRHTAEVKLPSGLRVLVRPLLPEDRDELEQALERLSPESRFRRFFRPVDRLSNRELRHLTELDYVNHFAWGARLVSEPGQPGVGVSRYVRLPDDPQAAEVAVVVVDEYQGQGIGGLLLHMAAETAITNGITHFTGLVLAENRPALQLLLALGAEAEPKGTVVSVSIPLPLPEDDFSRSDLYELLRRAGRGEIVQK